MNSVKVTFDLDEAVYVLTNMKSVIERSKTFRAHRWDETADSDFDRMMENQINVMQSAVDKLQLAIDTRDN